MKILFVVNNFEIGGPQKSLLSLIHLMKKKHPNYEIYLTSLNGSTTLNKFLPKDIKIVNSNSYIKLLMLDKRKIFKNLFSNIYRIKLLLNLMILLYKKVKFRKSFVQLKQEFWKVNTNKKIYDSNYYDIAVAVSGGHSMYYIVDHINSKNKIGWIRTDYKVLERDELIDAMYFKKMNTVLSVSEMCASSFERIFDFKPKVFYNPEPITLYEGIEKPYIIFDENKFNILSVMRLDPNKGLDFIIDSAINLKNKKLNFKWYIAGNGKLKNWLFNEIKKNNLENYIEMLGFVFNTGYLVEKSDIVVHPSRFEGKANTIDEALLYNKAVIATNFDTVYEQIDDNENGFIVDMNATSISNKIIDLYNNRESIHIISQNIINNNKNKKYRDKVEEFFDKVMR